MKLRLIRNATLKLDYAGQTILIDPYFAPRHSLPSYTGKSPNPLVDLPLSIDEILSGVDLVIVSHLHSDHFDSVAKERVPKSLPILCQPGDEETIRAAGFADVTPLSSAFDWKEISIRLREGSHGLGHVLDKMGSVMGLTLQGEGEPCIYWAGDTVLYPPVLEVIESVRPDVIVTHSCGARWDGDLIVMDAEQTVRVAQAAGNALVVATHMEALDHATVTRADLARVREEAGLSPDRLFIPTDGEVLHIATAGAR